MFYCSRIFATTENALDYVSVVKNLTQYLSDAKEMNASSSYQCSSSEQSFDSFESIAKELGIPTNGNECRYTRDELSKKDPRGLYSEWIGDWECLALRNNLQDDQMKCSPSVKSVFAHKTPNKYVSNEMKYYGLVNKRYKYEIKSNSNGVPQVKIRIAFKSKGINSSEQISKMKVKIKEAEEIWKAPLNKKLDFSFEVVDSPKEADYVVDLSDEDIRAPYDSAWSTQYSPNTIAHEIGHMMGLCDEYDGLGSIVHSNSNDTADTKCSRTNLMCSNSSGTVRPYQYYLILRRAKCFNSEKRLDRLRAW